MEISPSLIDFRELSSGVSNESVSTSSKLFSSLSCIHTNGNDDEDDLQKQIDFARTSQKSKAKKRFLKFWKTKRKVGHAEFDKEQEKSNKKSITKRLRAVLGKTNKTKNTYKVNALPYSQDVTNTGSEDLAHEDQETIPLIKEMKETSSGTSEVTLHTDSAGLGGYRKTFSNHSPEIGKTQQKIPVFVEISANCEDTEDEDPLVSTLTEKENILVRREEELRNKQEKLRLREEKIEKKENEMKEKEEELMNMCTRIDHQSKELESILQNPRYIKFSRCRHVTVEDHRDHFEQLRHILDGLYTKNEELMALLKCHIQDLQSLPESTSDITDMVKKLSSDVKKLKDSTSSRDSLYYSQTDLSTSYERLSDAEVWGRSDIFSRMMSRQTDILEWIKCSNKVLVQIQESIEKLATRSEKE